MKGPLHENEHFFKGPTPPLSTLTFLASGYAQKWGLFSKDHTYRPFFVLFNKKNFFLMVPKCFNAYWTSVHAAESAN